MIELIKSALKLGNNIFYAIKQWFIDSPREEANKRVSKRMEDLDDKIKDARKSKPNKPS